MLACFGIGGLDLNSAVANAGEWQAKLGDRPFHGCYTALLGRQGEYRGCSR
jgi:hypothetical protein